MVAKKSTSRGKFKQDMINTLRDALTSAPELPEKVEFTKADVIRELRDEIEALIERRYTLKQIAALLKEKGFSISVSGLRSHLNVKKMSEDERPADKIKKPKEEKKESKKSTEPEQLTFDVASIPE